MSINYSRQTAQLAIEKLKLVSKSIGVREKNL